MTALPKHEMTVAEFLAWSGSRAGDYELVRGEVFAMGRETVQHARAKRAAADALTSAIKAAGVPCESFIGGPGVSVKDDSYYVPDVAVHCGERLSGSVSLIPDPVIIVEVISGSTERYDLTAKSIDYFLVPSIRHYLIVDLKRHVVLHHRRGEGDAIPAAIMREGDIRLDPPGLSVAFADLFDEA